MAETFRCSDAADQRGEPLYGTASQVKRWLLLEQPGSWGSDALTQSRLPADVARELGVRAKAAGIRVVLIRRGVRFVGENRRCYFLRTEEGSRYQGVMDLETVDRLLDLDLSRLLDGTIPEVRDHPDPIFLVCTHGRHDACCSIRGNQVSRIACAEPLWDAWECSHIGGDRFAANVVCFPHGLYYGRVGPDDVVRLMDDYSNGILSLDHFRGRCTHPFVVQAAEYFVRRELGDTAIDGLALHGTRREPGVRVITFVSPEGRRIEARVRFSEEGDYRLTCRATRTNPIPRFELISCTIPA